MVLLNGGGGFPKEKQDEMEWNETLVNEINEGLVVHSVIN